MMLLNLLNWLLDHFQIAISSASLGAEFLLKAAQEPDEVMQALPAPTSPHPDLPQGSPVQINTTTVINRLEGLSKILKSRDLVRELASIDILLNEMGIASYFPELTDAQAKLIESFGYASNKIESIIAKMRGGGQTKPKQPGMPGAPQTPQPMKPMKPQRPQRAPGPPQTAIDTRELMDRPVGEVKEKLPPTTKG